MDAQSALTVSVLIQLQRVSSQFRATASRAS